MRNVTFACQETFEIVADNAAHLAAILASLSESGAVNNFDGPPKIAGLKIKLTRKPTFTGRYQ